MQYKISLIIGLVFLISTDLLAGTYDSLRLETKGEQRVVIHEVEAGETIFGLSRRYGASVEDIKESNSQSGNGLKIGQLLAIPTLSEEPIAATDAPTNYVNHEVVTGETLYGISRQYGLTVAELKTLNDMTDNALEVGAELIVGQRLVDSEADSPPIAVSPAQAELKPDSLPENTHIIGPGETIYSIARRYGVDVQELREANGLESNSISIDQRLIIPFEIAGVEDASIIVVADTAIVNDTISVSESDVLPEQVKYGNSDKRDTTNLIPGQMIEEGFAMKIENAPKTRKYLALHRTVPIGTIIQVRNQMNNQSIFVRVVGKLPDTGPNKKVLIRLTLQAFDRLGAIDPKIPVELAYMRE
jgi:LysM repeat protein